MATTTIGFELGELPGIERYLYLPSDVAFVSGSQQAGLGNSTSDYDLYIVYRDGLDRLKEGPKQFWLRDPHRRVDLERYGWQEIVEAGALVNGFESPSPADVRHVPFDAFDIYYRTAVGRPMMNESGFAELTAALDTERYDSAFAAWSLWQAGLALARARHSVHNGRPEAAFFSARLGLRHAVTAMMACFGHGWPNPKWAFVKLARHFGRESVEYQRAWHLNGLGRREVGDYVAAVGSYCEEQGAPFLVPASAGAAVYAWRGEATEVSIAGRAYLVHGRKDVYELDEAAEFICSLIDGERPLRESSAAFAERFGLEAPVASFRTEEMLAQLSAQGVLRRQDEFVLPEVAGDDGA